MEGEARPFEERGTATAREARPAAPVREPPGEREEAPAPPTGERAPAPPRGRRKRFLRIGAVAAVLLVGAVIWWLHARKYEDTDDAQIDANITAVSSRVPGTVVAVHVVDNQHVRDGEVLVELDPTDLEVAVAQAKAAAAQAEATVAVERPSVSITETSNVAAVRSAQADVDSARSDVDTAQQELDQATANARLAALNLARAKELLAGNSLARSDYDQRVTAAEVADAGVSAARKRLQGKRAKLVAALARQREVIQNAPRQVGTRQASVESRRANLELARAQLRQARLNLGYARVTAAADGIIGRKSVNVGDRIQPGQQLMALTQTSDIWVTANFRETQIRLMRPGQPAEVHVDAIDRDFRGKVESFPGATGSRYSLLPPENATGNYVKVVQRLPVRIRLDPGQPEFDRLRPGMSVEPSVRIR